MKLDNAFAAHLQLFHDLTFNIRGVCPNFSWKINTKNYDNILQHVRKVDRMSYNKFKVIRNMYKNHTKACKIIGSWKMFSFCD